MLDSIQTAVELIDDAVFTDDTSTHATGTTKLLGIGAAATPTDGSVGANDIGMVAMSLDRRLHVDAQIVGTDSALDVSGATVTVDLGSNNDVQGSVAEGAAVSGNPFLIAGDDGTNVRHVAVDTSGNVQVDLVTANVTNAGTFAVQVDGDALTALQLIDDAVYADDADWTDGTSKHMLVGGLYQSSEQTITDGDVGPVQVDSNGRVKVNLVKASDGLDIGSGNAGSETIRVSISTDDTNLSAVKTAIESINSCVYLDDANWVDSLSSHLLVGGLYQSSPQSITDGDVGPLQVDSNGRVLVSVDQPLPAGTNAIGKLAANSGVDIGDVDVTSISAGANLIGDVGIGVRTSGGTTLYKNIDVDESEDQIKGTAGQVYWMHVMNLASSVRYLKFYNATAASVTVGTTVPDLTFPIPTQGDTNGAGYVLPIPNGIAFSTAITIAATTGIADNDSGAPGANEVVVNGGYA